jgi:hypothetical protein
MDHFTVIDPKHADIDLAQAHGTFEHRIENRREVAGRGIDDPHDFGHCGLLSKCLVALPGALVEPLLQLGVGTPKICNFFIEHRGHVLAPSPALDRMIFDRHPLQPRKTYDSITFASSASRRFDVRVPAGLTAENHR